MCNQGGTKVRVLRQIRTAMSRHPDQFNKYQTGPDAIISKLTTNQ